VTEATLEDGVPVTAGGEPALILAVGARSGRAR